MSDYYADDVIENKLGLNDPVLLHQTEELLVARNAHTLLNEELVTIPDEGFFINIHKRLFEDLYDFAGKFREVDITKPNSIVPFCYARFLKSESRRIFDDLKSINYLAGLDIGLFVERIAHIATELNALHPFREGNGRTIRLYLIFLADYAGYIVDYSRVRPEDIIFADKRAFEGDDTLLIALYEKVVIKAL
jgi:cell filamentation protein